MLYQVVDIVHPKTSGISRKELKEKLAAMYEVKDPSCIQVFGLKTQFGGGATSGFAFIYDTLASRKKFSPLFHMYRDEEAKKPERTGRKQRKERKNRNKNTRGTGKAASKRKKSDDSK